MSIIRAQVIKPITLDTLAYRYKMDTRLLRTQAKGDSYKTELLERRLNKHKEDILKYVLKHYGLKFDETYGKETDINGKETDAKETEGECQ